MQQGYVIPTLADLYADDATAFRNDGFMKLLNSEPPAQFVKVEKGIAYLPIDKVEILLDRIFVGRVQVEIKDVKLLLNAVQATIRLHVFHPILQMWVFNDGAGAQPIQLAAGAKGDLTKVNHAAIQMNTPAAVSFAVKDAAERFGKIFGRDLSRKDTVNYQPAFLYDPYSGMNQQEQQPGIVQPGVINPPPPPSVPGNFQSVINGNVAQQQQAAQAGQTFNQQQTPQPQSQPGAFSAGFLGAVNQQQTNNGNQQIIF